MALPVLCYGTYDHPRGEDRAALGYDPPGDRKIRADVFTPAGGGEERIDTSVTPDPGRLSCCLMLQSDATILRVLYEKYLATVPPPVPTAGEAAIYDALVALGL